MSEEGRETGVLQDPAVRQDVDLGVHGTTTVDEDVRLIIGGWAGQDTLDNLDYMRWYLRRTQEETERTSLVKRKP